MLDLPLQSPILNAAGTLGFHPAARNVDLSGLGAFITNPISLEPRSPTGGPRMKTFRGGLLLHTGHPNPGLDRVIQRFARHWAGSPIPVIAHLLVTTPQDTKECVQQIEEIEGVFAIEIGFPPGISRGEALKILQVARGELPVIAKIGLDEVKHLAPVVVEAAISALSLGPPRGRLPDGSNWISGRLFGPAIYPFAMEVLEGLRDLGVTTFFAGGVGTKKALQSALHAGAAGVQLDYLLWRNGGISALEE